MDNPVLTQWLTQPGGLATQLGELRRAADLTGAALARRLDWVPSKVSRVQGGRILPTANEIEAWCEACGAAERAAELIEILGEASAKRMPWRQRVARGQRSNQAAYTELHRKAEAVTMVEMAVIPSVLQTADYARRIMETIGSLRSDLPLGDLEAALVARMDRAALIDEVERPYRFVINEGALLGTPATPAVMVAQLEKLLSDMDRPNVELWIIPQRTELSVIPVSPFSIYTIGGQDLVLVETFHGETEHVTPADVEAHRRAFEWLMGASSTGDEARSLIQTAIERAR